MAKLKFLLYFFMVFLLGCRINSTKPQNQAPNEIIIFSSSRDGNSNIYQMNSDGSNLIALTNSTFEEWAPTIKDKNTISFLRQEEDSIRRYELNLISKEEILISHPTSCYLDDKNVIYDLESDKELISCKNTIYVGNSMGVYSQFASFYKKELYYPAWVPGSKGKKITFTSNREGNNDIYVIDFNGNNLKNLTNNPANDERGQFSPDGKFLLFSSNRENENQDLFILNLENQSLENITNTPATELIGKWSDDGKRIYFGSNKDGNWEIYVYNVIQKNTKRLTNSPEFDGDPQIL